MQIVVQANREYGLRAVENMGSVLAVWSRQEWNIDNVECSQLCIWHVGLKGRAVVAVKLWTVGYSRGVASWLQ